jgi:hypothetical protein
MMQMYMDTEALVSVLMRAHLSSRVCSDGEIARSEREKKKKRRLALTVSYGLWPLWPTSVTRWCVPIRCGGFG